MNIIRRIIFHIKFQSFLPDRIYLKRKYKNKVGVKLNLNKPVTFTEKIQWLKLYDKNPLYVICADKVKVREYVKTRIGEEYLIPLLHVSSKPSEIPFDKLPAEYIIKANNSSGQNLIIKDEKVNSFEDLHPFKKSEIIATLESWIKSKFYLINREWEYKNIKPKILVEKLLRDESGNSALNDYKIHCFEGKPVYIQTLFDRIDGGLKETWYDLEWNLLDIYYVTPDKKNVTKPDNLAEMFEISAKLAQGFKYVRVDLYNVNNRIYFGELTFRPYGGFMKFKPEKWNFKFGDLIQL